MRPQLRLQLFGQVIQTEQGRFEIQARKLDRRQLERSNVQRHIGRIILKNISEPLHRG